MRFAHNLLELCKFCVLLTGLACSVGCAERAEPTPEGEVRLAVLSPALADTLHRLGHAELIVGRQQFDRFTDQDVPAVGDLTGIDYEMLLLARPTHIIAQQTQACLPKRLHDIAGERGWQVHELPLLTLDDSIASIELLDSLAGGSGEAGSELTEQLRQSLKPDLALGKTAIVASAAPLAVIGPGAFHWEIVRSLGGEPVPVSGPAYLTLDAESFAALAPDTIVVLAPGENPDASMEELLGAASAIEMEAVAGGRVIVVPDPKCLLPSTALLDFVERIRAEAQRLGPAPGS